MSTKTPFLDEIQRLSADAGGRFHMPGHKGDAEALGPLEATARWDITEIPGADDLQKPEGALRESEENMARLYGSGATLYSASGSTSCIEAMLKLFCPLGSRVLMGRNCHVAAVRALAFCDIEPVWLLPEAGRVRAEALEEAFRGGPRVAAVYVTSPDYYGRMSDVAALAAVCRAHGVPLLVDNAHGAHLRFLGQDMHPMSLGADACCDSAHKTLPCLTPAAMLHLRDGGLKTAARRALNLFSSTSPSYLVLASLDHAAGLLGTQKADFEAAGRCLGAATGGVEGLAMPVDDPLKAVLCPEAAGIPYDTVIEALAAENIVPEMADGQRIVLMASPFNSEEGFERLARAIAGLPSAQPGVFVEERLPLPQTALAVRDAVFGPVENVATGDAVGRIAAEFCAPCPPGIPIVVPGEQLDRAAVERLLARSILTLDVVK